MLATPNLTLKRRLKASPAKVYAAWTDPERLMAWWGPADCTATRAEMDTKVDGRFRIVMTAENGEEHDVRGIYREVVPEQKLVFTWAWRTTPERESLVTILLKPDGDGTLLTLTHEQFLDVAARDGHQRGWGQALDKLERYIA